MCRGPLRESTLWGTFITFSMVKDLHLQSFSTQLHYLCSTNLLHRHTKGKIKSNLWSISKILIRMGSKAKFCNSGFNGWKVWFDPSQRRKSKYTPKKDHMQWTLGLTKPLQYEVLVFFAPSEHHTQTYCYMWIRRWNNCSWIYHGKCCARLTS